jgi:hypothetical protein
MEKIVRSLEFPGVEDGPHCVVDGVAYEVNTQIVTPFNAAGGIPVSVSARLGCITDGTYYYPGATLRGMVGSTKSRWAKSGLRVWGG